MHYGALKDLISDSQRILRTQGGGRNMAETFVQTVPTAKPATRAYFYRYLQQEPEGEGRRGKGNLLCVCGPAEQKQPANRQATKPTPLQTPQGVSPDRIQ